MDYSKLSESKLREIVINQAKILESIDKREQYVYDYLIEHEADFFSGWEILELINDSASKNPYVLGKDK